MLGCLYGALRFLTATLSFLHPLHTAPPHLFLLFLLPHPPLIFLLSSYPASLPPLLQPFLFSRIIPSFSLSPFPFFFLSCFSTSSSILSIISFSSSFHSCSSTSLFSSFPSAFPSSFYFLLPTSLLLLLHFILPFLLFVLPFYLPSFPPVLFCVPVHLPAFSSNSFLHSSFFSLLIVSFFPFFLINAFNPLSFLLFCFTFLREMPSAK